MAKRITGIQIVLMSALVLIAAKMNAGPLPQVTATSRTAAAPTPTPPQKREGHAGPAASSAPALPAATPASSSVPILNTPQHSPDQLDFGSVADGASSIKTFTLTTNAAGNVAVTIPSGPFRVAEFREMGPLPGGSKNPGGSLNTGGVSHARSRISYREGQPGPFQWSMAPNVQMQVDIVFAPKSQGTAIAGPKSAVMNVTGPGPRGNWVLTIPLRGMVNGMKVATTEGPQAKTGNQSGVLPQSGHTGSAPGSPAISPPQPATSSSAGTMPRAPSGGQTRLGGRGDPKLLADLLAGSHPALLPIQRNPNLSEGGIDRGVLAILQQQKQAADIKSGETIAAKGARGSSTVAPTSSTRSAPGSSRGSSSAPNTGSLPRAGPGGVDPNASPAIVDPFPCEHAYPRPLILSVNSQKKGTIFTTDPAWNLFTFEGCNFGDAKGSMYLRGGFTQGQVPMQIESWNDNGIVAKVQPNLTGELDQDNVQMRLFKSNSSFYDTFSGYKFSAARVETLLPVINAEVHLADPFTPCTLTICLWNTPGNDVPRYPFTPPPTLEAFRMGDDSQLQGRSGTDNYTLSNLPPGFLISQVGLGVFPGASVKAKIDNNNRNIQVSFVFGQMADLGNKKHYSASYSLNIWVIGPKGVHW